MEKKLLVSKPVIACDIEETDLMTILGVHKDSEAYQKWFVRNFIDLWCFKKNNENLFSFSKPATNKLHCFRPEGTRHDYFDRPFSDCSIFDCELLIRKEYDRDTLEKKYNSIVDMVIDFIDKEFYLLFEIDAFYIPCALFNGKIHYNSLTLIWGYDSDREMIYVADFYGSFDRNVAFKFREISFIDLIKAYSSYECSKNLDYERIMTIKFDDKDICINKIGLK